MEQFRKALRCWRLDPRGVAAKRDKVQRQDNRDGGPGADRNSEHIQRLGWISLGRDAQGQAHNLLEVKHQRRAQNTDGRKRQATIDCNHKERVYTTWNDVTKSGLGSISNTPPEMRHRKNLQKRNTPPEAEKDPDKLKKPSHQIFR